MKLTFLGTGSIPTEERSPQGMLLSFQEKHSILVDCGEGIQLQLLKAHIDVETIDRIFLTHEHVDHVLGVIGVIMMCYQQKKVVEVLGPKTTLNLVKKLMDQLADFAKNNLVYKELEPGQAIVTTDYCCTCFHTFHTPDSLGYRFEHQKKHVTFTGDLKIHSDDELEQLVKSLKNSDVAIIDGVHIRPNSMIELIQKAEIKSSYLLPIRHDTTVEKLNELFKRHHINVFVPNDFDEVFIGA